MTESNLPEGLKSGHPARLFPALSDSSKENRATSVTLFCIAHINEFADRLFSSLGQKVGARAKIDSYVEVGFEKLDVSDRKPGAKPDGLIIVGKNKGKEWRVLIESKIGSSQLDKAQIEKYLEIAKANKIDALLTISNQFAARPDHHPIEISKPSMKGLQLFHWSWKHVLTEALLLLESDEIKDATKRKMLSELVIFLKDKSTGVQNFEKMPASWTEVLASVKVHAPMHYSDSKVVDVVGAWHQEIRDLSLIMSERVGEHVAVHLSNAHKGDQDRRRQDDSKCLVGTNQMNCELVVPNAASNIHVSADLARRAIVVSMVLNAPSDTKRFQTQINWLLKQLQAAKSDNIHIRAHWPTKSPNTQESLNRVRADTDLLVREGNEKAIVNNLK